MFVMGRTGFIGFIIFLVFGAYLIIRSLGLIIFPSIVTNFDKWIYLAAGILLVLGGIYFWKEKRH